MSSALLLVLLSANAPPCYEWYDVRIPKELFVVEEFSRGQVGLAVHEDGQRVAVVTTRGALLVDRRKNQKQPIRRSRFSVSEVADVAFLDEKRLVFTTFSEIVQVSFIDGRILKRVKSPLQLGHFTLLNAGYLVGVARPEGKSFPAHALVSPEDGKVLFDFGDEAGMRSVMASDRWGIRFATGCVTGGILVGDPSTRSLRYVVGSTGGNPVRAACFDPTGRYLAISWGYCEAAVVDLLGPTVSEAAKASGYLGKFGQAWRGSTDAPRGMGCIDEDWLWFAGGRDLYFCSWRDRKVIAGIGPYANADCFVWKGSLDGHLLVAIDYLGTVWFGRLCKEERTDTSAAASKDGIN